jgi:hypothetical protein
MVTQLKKQKVGLNFFGVVRPLLFFQTVQHTKIVMDTVVEQNLYIVNKT